MYLEWHASQDKEVWRLALYKLRPRGFRALVFEHLSPRPLRSYPSAFALGPSFVSRFGSIFF